MVKQQTRLSLARQDQATRHSGRMIQWTKPTTPRLQQLQDRDQSDPWRVSTCLSMPLGSSSASDPPAVSINNYTQLWLVSKEVSTSLHHGGDNGNTARVLWPWWRQMVPQWQHCQSAVTMVATDGPTMATLPECCDHGGDRWSHNGNTARVLWPWGRQMFPQWQHCQSAVTMVATDGPTMATLPECCDHGGDRWSHNGNTARVLWPWGRQMVPQWQHCQSAVTRIMYWHNVLQGSKQSWWVINIFNLVLTSYLTHQFDRSIYVVGSLMVRNLFD